MGKTVVIDCFPESAARYVADHAIAVIDVIRSTTLVVTAIAEGRRCLVASSAANAIALRSRLGDALLAGELSGDMPDGFDMNNSPAELASRDDAGRPVVTLSTSGTKLMLAASHAALGAQAVCFRNFSAAAHSLANQPGPIAIIGAGSRGEFRIEDQMCCAWMAQELVEEGWTPADSRTSEIIERWTGASPTAVDAGNSVSYLRRSGQLDDRDFIVSHVDDLDLVCVIEDNEVHGVAAVGSEPVTSRAALSPSFRHQGP